MERRAATLLLSLSTLCFLPAVAPAQISSDIDFRFGYAISSRYTRNSGGSATNTGLEFGVDLPILPKIPLGPGLGGLTVAFSPSLDLMNTGQIYRFLATASAPIPQTGLYGRFGLGYAYASNGGSNFNSKSAYEIDYTLGLPILTQIPGIKVNAEVTYHQSSQALVGGWTIGLNAKF